MANRPRMMPNVDFGWSRQSPDLAQNYLNLLYITIRNCLCTAIRLCWTATRSPSKFTLPLPTSDWRRVLVLAGFYTGGTPGGGGGSPKPGAGDYKSQRNKLSVSFSHSGDLQSTSHHWPSQQPPIHLFHTMLMLCYGFLWRRSLYALAFLALPFQLFFHGLFQALSLLKK